MDFISYIMGHGVQWSDPNTQSGYGSVPCVVTVCYFGPVCRSVLLYYIMKPVYQLAALMCRPRSRCLSPGGMRGRST